jgi:membrane-associated protease RseP (regulator of RpoE activity)
VSEPTTPAPAVASEPRSGIFVPKWVGILVAAIVAALVFGAIGYAIGDSNGGGSSQNATRVFPGDGNGPFNGNRPSLPNGRQLPGNGPLGGNGTGNSGNGNQNGPDAGSTAFLGVHIQNANGGAAIVDVQNASPAATAGLQAGDVITAVDGTSVTSAATLAQAVQTHNAGDQVTITYTRDGKSATAKVTLGTRSASQNS